MRYTVDRITEKFVVLQNDKGVSGQVDKALFSFLEEGDVLSVTVDSAETHATKDTMKAKLHSLFQKGQKDDES